MRMHDTLTRCLERVCRYAGKWSECANQTDAYIMKGSGKTETYTPSFTYHGFQFVEVFGMPKDGKLLCHFVHSDLPRVGRVLLPKVAARNSPEALRAQLLDKSSALVERGGSATADILNRVAEATRMATRSQLFSIPTDCPQREKRGWMGDAHMTSENLMTSYDALAFHSSFVRSIRDDQVRGCANTTSAYCPPLSHSVAVLC